LLYAPSNILHVTDQPSAGVLAFLALATRELVEAGVQQTVLHGQRSDATPIERYFHPQVRLVSMERPSGASPFKPLDAFRAALCHELSSQRCDAVHLHAPRAGWMGRAVLSGVGGHPPVYYSPHGLRHLNRERPLTAAWASMMERLAGLSAFRPVACSLGEARELERLTHRTVAVLENPVDSAFFGVERLPDAQPRVITVGRACEQKGADVFAELAARFHFVGENVRFVWVGAGDARCEQELKAAGVEVTGWLDADDVRAQLARAHLYVQTSRWEGMSLSVLQAMAVGLPCVVTDVVGNRDAITHERTGLLAGDLSSLAVQVKQLLEEGDRARRLGDAAREEARQRFHATRFRRALLSLYRLEGELLPASPRAGGALDTALP
jgi:glycosyltransferase involved in cell wall biosynthesis